MKFKDLNMKPNTLYFVPLSGQEEDVGQSHLLGNQQDGFILVDLGLDSEHATSNVFPYLDNLQAIFLTHAHTDHIGGIVSYLVGNMTYEGKHHTFPPIYALPFTLDKIKQDLIEAKVPNNHWPTLISINSGESVQFNNLSIKAMPAYHSVPTVGYVVRDNVGGGSVFLTGDTAAGRELSLDLAREEGDKGITTLLVDAADAIIPGTAKDLKELSKHIHHLIKNNPENLVFVVPPSRTYHALAIKEAALNAGYGVIYSDTGYKDSFLNVAENMGVNIGKPGLRNIFITDNPKSVPNLPNESKFVFVGRSPDKLGSKQLYLSMAAHGQREDIIRIISATRPHYTIPTHCSIEESKAFTQMCNDKKIQTPSFRIQNGSILEITPDNIDEIGRIDVERIRLLDGRLVKLSQQVNNSILKQLQIRSR